MKHKLIDEILHFKAQLVVKNYSQQEDINYNKTYASTIKDISYKTIFALYTARDRDIDYINVKIAFLNKLMEGIIFVSQTKDYYDGSARV